MLIMGLSAHFDIHRLTMILPSRTSGPRSVLLCLDASGNDQLRVLLSYVSERAILSCQLL